MASNNSTIQDEFRYLKIELKSQATSIPVELSGYYLTDDLENPKNGL